MKTYCIILQSRYDNSTLFITIRATDAKQAGINAGLMYPAYNVVEIS